MWISTCAQLQDSLFAMTMTALLLLQADTRDRGVALRPPLFFFFFLTHVSPCEGCLYVVSK